VTGLGPVQSFALRALVKTVERIARSLFYDAGAAPLVAIASSAASIRAVVT
jgi:hypothetical protein